MPFLDFFPRDARRGLLGAGLVCVAVRCARTPIVQRETVMAPGTSITATTPTGVITIRAGEGVTRSYTWEGATRSVEMEPREERWYGSYGLYFPGPGDHWQEHNGITRGVLEEGQQHFQTTDAALRWIRERSATDDMPYVYTSGGLVVGWSKRLNRRQLNVDVWQILINGKKPTDLPGSRDGQIRVAGAGAPAV